MIVVRGRVQLRAHWRSWLLWALVVGLAGGIPLAAVAGARRTQSAYDRFLVDTATFDVLLTNGGTTPVNANRQFDLAEVTGWSEVADGAALLYYTPNGRSPDGRPVTPEDLTPLAPVDGRFGTDLIRTPLLSGRRPQGVDEIALSPLAADLIGAHTGDVLAMDLLGVEDVSSTGEVDPDPPGRLLVSGIIAVPSGFPPLTGGLPPIALLSPAYAEAHPDGVEVLAVRLRDGPAGITAFVDHLQRSTPDPVVTANRDELAVPVQRGLDVQATALRLFAALVGALWLLIVLQALRRRFAEDAVDDAVWSSLGAGRRELRRSRASFGVLVAPVAAAISVITAAALSVFLPVGLARDLEGGAGLRADGGVLSLGFVALVLVLLGLHGVAAWWQGVVDQPRVGGTRARRLTSRLVSGRLPATTALGIHMAVEPGRGRRSVPVRSTMVTVGVGVAAVAGVLVFATSLNRLFSEPSLYGWAWDVQVGDSFSPDLGDLAAELRADPGAEIVAGAAVSRLSVDGVSLDALAIDPAAGLEPTVFDGAAARAPDEIVLGGRTARRLGIGVGDAVTADIGDRHAEFTMVGRGVFPVGAGSAGLGEGVALTVGGLRRLDPDAVKNVLLVDVTPDAAGDALVEDLRSTRPASVYLPQKPADLTSLERLGGLPSLVAMLLAGAGLLVLTTTLVASARRRRGELATLKALGLQARQIGGIVLWQAATLVAVAVVIGLPVGVASGRLLWQVFADRLGVPFEPEVAWAGLGVLVVAAVAASLLVALLPAWSAARGRPGPALRAE